MVAAEVAAQLLALPGVKPMELSWRPLLVASMSIAPAWHAASAADWAAWRCDHRLLMSTAKPRPANRSNARMTRRPTAACPDSGESWPTGWILWAARLGALEDNASLPCGVHRDAGGRNIALKEGGIVVGDGDADPGLGPGGAVRVAHRNGEAFGR